MWEMGYSKDPESSSESWCPWIFTEQSSLPFFTFTFVFIFFANLPAHTAWAWASAGGWGAGEAPLICFQDACSLGPGTELHAQGTGERNLNLELSPYGEQETRNKVERVQFASLRSPVEVIRIALSSPGTWELRASSASESRLTEAGPPAAGAALGQGWVSSQIEYVLKVHEKKSVFPTFNLLFLSLLGSKPPVRRND